MIKNKIITQKETKAPYRGENYLKISRGWNSFLHDNKLENTTNAPFPNTLALFKEGSNYCRSTLELKLYICLKSDVQFVYYKAAPDRFLIFKIQKLCHCGYNFDY